MEKIVKKAIEGGFNFTPFDEGSKNGLKTNAHFNFDTVCNPLFWQALGKACGWKDTNYGYELKNFIGNQVTSTQAGSEAIFKALKFHEINLTEGWEKALKYLENLINK